MGADATSESSNTRSARERRSRYPQRLLNKTVLAKRLNRTYISEFSEGARVIPRALIEFSFAANARSRRDGQTPAASPTLMPVLHNQQLHIKISHGESRIRDDPFAELNR